MIFKLLLIIVFQLLLSYFFFKKFNALRPIVLNNDEFSAFQRGDVVCGGGIVFLLIFIIFFFLYIFFLGFGSFVPKNILIFFLSLGVLTFISYQDDKKSLDPILRLIVQIVCVYFSLATVPHIVDFLPIKISILVAFLTWVYIINITNFIDGADGFCVINCTFFFLIVISISLNSDLILFSFFISVLILPILIIFLIFFNYPPAKLFMGDAGAIFLGFLVGYCIIELSFYGLYYAVFAAFSYPILDCTLTLIKKVSRGHLPWERLGDYYFLLPKKRKKKLNFLITEKKLFFSITSLMVVNFLIINLAIIFNKQFLSLLCFITSYCLIRVYIKFS